MHLLPYPKAMLATPVPITWRMLDSSALYVRQSKTQHHRESTALPGALQSHSTPPCLLEERPPFCTSSKPHRAVQATGMCSPLSSPRHPDYSNPFSTQCKSRQKATLQRSHWKARDRGYWLTLFLRHQGGDMISQCCAVPAWGRGWCSESEIALPAHFSVADLNFVPALGTENS